jgi:hypothetical protein
MNHAVLSRTHQFRSGALKSLGSKLGVSNGQSLFNLTQKSAHTAATRSVDNCAPLNFANGFFGRFGIGHVWRSSTMKEPPDGSQK